MSSSPARKLSLCVAVRKIPLRVALAATLSLTALSAATAPPAHALAYVPCPTSPAFSCTTLPVPLARSGAAPGEISLSVELKQAGSVPSRDAVVALAGGPGQAALPLGEFAAKALAPALAGRDLIVFDQRGTGSSDPLSCSALEKFSTNPVYEIFRECAFEIGLARGAFTTEESVEDIESIRQAGGYEKLVLYGTSYGTKVAEEYAERYPQNVEALVLDSVVPTDGPEPLHIATFQAIAPVLDELCSNRACAGITSNPVADLANLNARLHKHVLSGSVYDGSGRRHAATLDEVGLLSLLEAGDVNPALRALLPAAVHSALHHEPAPLLRLQALADDLIPSVPIKNTSPEASPEIDEALHATTTCEESPFPWSRNASAETRLNEALAYLHAQPVSAFYPFSADTALDYGAIPECLAWPNASQPPPPTSALPDVPTLILSGEQDLRTPTTNARTIAAQISDAQLLVVPFTGHSVLGADFSGCAEQAVATFFANAPVQPCTSTKDIFAPTPLTPTKLAYVHSPPGLGGKPGRTLTAVLDTIVDLSRQVNGATLQTQGQLPSGSSFGGLHGGYAKLDPSMVSLRNLVYITGVQLSGTIPVKDGALQTATLHITGAEASAGTVRVGSASKQVIGVLGGKRFDVNLAKVKLSRYTGTGEWPSHPVSFPLPGLARLR